MILSGISTIVISVSALMGQDEYLDIMDVFRHGFLMVSVSFLARSDYSLAVGTAVFLIMGILFIMVGLHHPNNVLDFMDIPSLPYNIAKILISATILYYVTLTIRYEAVTSEMKSLFFGLSIFSFSASVLLQSSSGVKIMNFMFGPGIPILIAGFMMNINSCRYIYRLEIRAYGEWSRQDIFVFCFFKRFSVKFRKLRA